MPESTTSAVKGQGVFLTGELVSSGSQEPWTAPDGTRFDESFGAKLLVNDQLLRVRFKTAADMAAALGSAKRGDPVTIPVFVNGKFDPETRTRGSVSFSYRGA